MYSWINNILLGLKDTYDISNIYDLFDCLNIKIVKLESNNILLQGNEAFYYRAYLGKELVFIKNDLYLEYEKFVLAHELGHAVLHTDIYEAAFSKRLLNIGKLERQANYFAFKLLDIDLDPITYQDFTIGQIASSLNLPTHCIEEFIK